MVANLEFHPVGPGRLEPVHRLFGATRSTRHCSCMAFCSTSWQFALGWYGGGNRRRFDALSVSQPDPMGVMATRDDDPVGWCACGPRARYTVALGGRSKLLSARPREQDDDVWLIACLFVPPVAEGSGVAVPLLRAAIALAADAGAAAVEAWPLASGVRRPAEAHVGREGVFGRLGFRCVARPSPERVIMRLELRSAPG
jgi:GNAT superfamily N-acetyltransferase